MNPPKKYNVTNMKKTKLSQFLKTISPLILLATSALHAQNPAALPDVTVKGVSPLQRTAPSTQSSISDAGYWLRSFVGLDGMRLGGHGIDPVVRGLQQEGIRINFDGACITSGCPNRMDPATSYWAPALFDDVEIRRGVTTLADGPGAPGGSVLFHRRTERFTNQTPMRARMGSFYKSNGDTWGAWSDLAAGTPDFFGRAQFQWQDASNYTDGDGKSIRSAYSQIGGGFIAGWTPKEKTRFELALDYSRTRDALFAGAGMDSPDSTSKTLRLSGEHQLDKGVLSAFRFQAAVNEVSHLMDNYSLRTGNLTMKMKAPSETLTWSGMAAIDLDFEPILWTWGINWRLINQDAKRFMGPATGGDPSMLQSYLWPDVDTDTFGIFTEAKWEVNENFTLTGGLRIDQTIAQAHKAAQIAANQGGINSPIGLYRAYYGTDDLRQTEIAMGGLLRSEWRFDNSGSFLYAAFSRSVRTADATERFMASNNAMGSMRWVGNPDIKPEVHHQLEAGATWILGNVRLQPSLFYDWVEDYILYDRARDLSMALNNAGIYRNVDAERWGGEFEGEVIWFKHFRLFGSVAYVHSTNTEDKRPLPLTPPLSGRIGVEWNEDRWSVGTALNMAATQNRVEERSPLEVGETSGWATLDLYASVRPWEYATLRAGITNILDHTYARHLNRANMFDNQSIRIHEPGRSFWVSLEIQF
jgi:iron complex outermembrane receptor protein